MCPYTCCLIALLILLFIYFNSKCGGESMSPGSNCRFDAECGSFSQCQGGICIRSPFARPKNT